MRRGKKLLKNVKVITNNISVHEKYRQDMEIIFLDGQYIDVLKQARDRIHKGAALVSHPLMGSIKPNETPYRSVLIKDGAGLDFESLSIIEGSIATCEKLLRDRATPDWSEGILKDFRLIDLRLLESALDSIN